ncbi:IS3 family transposase [Nocardia uniformis]|uniref:IS3 family transposase n=1 Tax=Nocardia uniformis TaxID=53432 RepID=A0A849CGH2_9NOCA|nr:IS3 family transposase [Nocardia uniformis]NNH76090.1 IS3 family transposase [Nocardia uniformis]
MGSSSRGSGRPGRRAFTAAEKLAHLAAYEAAVATGEGGAYLRREGLYSSTIGQWRKQRDAGVLDPADPATKVGKLTAEQAEIARLKKELDAANKRIATTDAALDIMGKAHALLEDLRERGAGPAATQALMIAYGQLVEATVGTRRAAILTGINRSTAHRRTKTALGQQLRASRPVPVNKLTDAERARVLAVLNSAEFVDHAPLTVWAMLLDEGTYLCSVSTMYRILAENAQVKERRRLARHPQSTCPELVATRPRQVYSWDITKLAGPSKGVYYDAYVMIDIYSRYIVGAHVHTRESGVLATELMEEIFGTHGIPQVVHADRGTAMTSKTVTALLADLQVTRSHSRPRVSNDNPFSEAWFKTLKYAPEFPARFGSVWHARDFMDRFVDWYNHDHRHTGIGLHTPAEVFYDLAAARDTDRRATLAAARARNPHRFGGITAAPKIIDLPTAAWINPPTQEDQQPAAA